MILLLVRPNAPWNQDQHFPSSSEDGEDATLSRDGQGRIEAQYNDDEEEADVEEGTGGPTNKRAITMGNGRAADNDRAPALQPSSLHREQREHNEWT